MEKEVSLLSRLAANYLFLGQFEPLRAALLSLCRRDPSLSLSILRSIVSSGGRIDGIRCPALLAWLCVLELLDHGGGGPDGANPEALRAKAEFLLLVHLVCAGVSDSAPDGEVSISAVDSVALLDRISDLGLRRLKAEMGDGGDEGHVADSAFKEEELRSLWKVCLDQPEIFDELSWNIQRQVGDSGLSDAGSMVEETEGLKLIQEGVQMAHLDALRECLAEDDLDGAIPHLRFLHWDFGSESEYRTVLENLVKKACLLKNGYPDTWDAFRSKMLSVYEAGLSSNCIELIQMLQEIQDILLAEEVEEHRVSSSYSMPLPLQHLHNFLESLCSGDVMYNDDKASRNMVIQSCMREMYHYARINGLHVLECVMDTALAAVKGERLEEASNVLSLFPLLQPLVAVMGWDLLSGKTQSRKRLMKLLWTSKSQVLRLEEFSFYGKQSDEMSCVEYLCDLLCYQLDLASFVACVNSGRQWDSKSSLHFSRKDQILNDTDSGFSDPFVENLVLERLASQSPMRVLFDVVPVIKFQDAIELISMQPIASSSEAWKRKEEIELIHMRYALESAVLALRTMVRCMVGDGENQYAMSYLKDLQSHVEALSSIPRKIFMVSIIISLLHMDDTSFDLTRCDTSGTSPDVSNTSMREKPDHISACEGSNKMVISFTGLLLDILHRNLPKGVNELEHCGKEALEWRISSSRRFIEDWEWRLSILQRLQPLSEWSWKEALTILHAAPSKLLNLCMQRAKYDIGEEAVHRFSLPPEDKAALELAEWVAGAFQRASVEDVVSRVAEGNSNTLQELDFSSLRAQLGPLAAILLCIDVAATSARSSSMCKQLLDQARNMLSDIYPGGAPRSGAAYWDWIHEVSIISTTRRVLQRLQDFFEQDKVSTLQEIFTGDTMVSSSKEPNRQGPRQRALSILHQMIDDAHKGKRQFLSGKLHNLARAVADEEAGTDLVKSDSVYVDRKLTSSSKKGSILGLGLRAIKPSVASTTGDNSRDIAGYDMKDSGKRFLGILSSKATTYLSAFIIYIATIGDIVDGIDTTHDFNFFSLIYEWPKDLITRLVFERGSTDAAAKVADIMSADFVHEVISACVPPVFPPRSGHGWACIPILPAIQMNIEDRAEFHSIKDTKSCSNYSSVPLGTHLHPLQLDIVKHLAKMSPVRAVLACVFGSSILSNVTESLASRSSNDSIMNAPDSDRLFYEFALDQSERFPTLKRWIQMQSNLHRVSESSISAGGEAETVVRSKSKFAVKRCREPESDNESEVDETVVDSQSLPVLANFNADDHRTSEFWHDSPGPEILGLGSTVFLSFDLENEVPYQKAVEKLIGEGKLADALALSDRCLNEGASDELLQLLVENGEEKKANFVQHQGYGSQNFVNDSWQYCLRLKDKHLAARLALKYLHKWDLDAAMDILTMCGCHLPQSDPIRDEVLQMGRALQRYSHILSADDRYKCWQEVEADCKEDPEGLALRLAGKGAVSAALEVAESSALSLDLRRELQGRQLVKLLTADPLNGGGPAEASRFLSSLRDSDDALPAAMGAMQLLPDLRSKQLLVHFFLKRGAGNLSDAELSRLNSWALGLRVLATLPLPWQQRCAVLHGHPHLILEVLLMRKQLESASLILKEFPSLRDNNLILTYSAKAIAVSSNSPPREPRTSVMGTRQKQKSRVGASSRSNFSNSLSNLQKEARRAFSWAPRDSGSKSAPKEVYRKRKSSGFAPSERVDWESMSGIQEDRVSVYSTEGQERLPSVSIAEGWVLSGDPIKDDTVRLSHRYESSPDVILFKALLSLCSDELISAKGAIDLCVAQMKNVLSAQQLPLHASMEILGRAYYATETFVQALVYAKSQLRKLAGSSDLSINSEKSRDADDSSSDAGSSGINSPYTDELSELLAQSDIWLGRAELLQSLLGSGIVASLDDIADKESSARLRDRLIEDERYSMAIYTCKKCKIDSFPVWNAWGHALIRVEHYAQARVKFKQAFQLYKGDPTPVILEIINELEGSPPVDVSAVRSMYEHLAKSAPTILDDSLSADSYLNVLYMPSTFPRSERSRQSQEVSNPHSSSNSEFDDGPRSNLDNVRYIECINYFQEYARQLMLGFMFRHGHYTDACMLFFPPDGIPPQPLSLPLASPSSSTQRMDPLATDYGTIDELCDLCVGYGAMGILEDIISARVSMTASQDSAVSQYTASALARICLYCETHRLFNFLYRFQVISKDHVAAGLCCIQLFMNSSSQEEALKHLENAKMHFQEGLSARHKSNEGAKLISKAARGKSASEKLSEDELVKFGARVAIQMDVVRSFNDTDKSPWRNSLFGNPNDPETSRRRSVIAETLAEKNFDLGFRVIYEFGLPAVAIYAGVAASLAERKKGSQLTDFLKNIKGTIDDDEWDQVLGAAINVYANKHKERPDRLIDMLHSSHRKVLACVVCGRLKSAFQIASRSGSVADVQYVAHQALHANALSVLDMCKQWLAQYM